MNRAKTLGAPSALLLAALLLTGCASVSVTSERYVGAGEYPPSNAASVRIMRREPKKPHVQVGEIVVSPSGSPEVAEIESAIRAEAAKLGADVAVLVYDKTKRVGTIVSGPWWARSRTPVYGRKIVAVAVKFKGEREE